MNVASLENCKRLYGHYVVTEDGRVYSDYYGDWRELRQDTLRGYKKVGLIVNGRQKRFQVHRLVAACYIPNPDNNPEVNHKDGNPANNHVDNLERCTPKENTSHAIANGRSDLTRTQGSKHGMSKLTDEEASYIKHEIASIPALALRFGVSHQTVRDIKTGKRWKHVK